MLRNPFTPTLIASHPEQFFGRQPELQELERSLAQGSVAITGGVGIGKSSLMARGLAMMEGFASPHASQSVLTVGHRDINSIDAIARRLLERFVGIDEKQNSVKFSLGSVIEVSSNEIVGFFREGRHLDALQRVLEADYLHRMLKADQLLLLAIDEADKCPIPIARLIRSVVTHTQHEGINNVRFMVAGASPFFHQMVAEDRGITRFFYRNINLEPMSPEDADDLITTKLDHLVSEAERDGIELGYRGEVIDKIVALSGGHPTILQLLGSHVVEHENSDPDGMIDSRDLFNSLRAICYGVRGPVYEDIIHDLEGQGKLVALQLLLAIGSVKLGFLIWPELTATLLRVKCKLEGGWRFIWHRPM